MTKVLPHLEKINQSYSYVIWRWEFNCVVNVPDGFKVYLSSLTYKSGHESFDGAGSRPEIKVAVDRWTKGDGEPKDDHDQPSQSQVHQDVVKRLAELLVLRCDQQCESIDGETEDDQKEHVDGQQFELPRLC